MAKTQGQVAKKIVLEVDKYLDKKTPRTQFSANISKDIEALINSYASLRGITKGEALTEMVVYFLNNGPTEEQLVEIEKFKVAGQSFNKPII